MVLAYVTLPLISLDAERLCKGGRKESELLRLAVCFLRVSVQNHRWAQDGRIPSFLSLLKCSVFSLLFAVSSLERASYLVLWLPGSARGAGFALSKPHLPAHFALD